MSRMTLDKITTGRQRRPLRAVVYGVEGVGKSTFCANAPAPVFIGAEDGTDALDVNRFPTPETWDDILEAIGTLYDGGHDFKTVVLDSADWAQKLCYASVAQDAGHNSIEDFGYGKGLVIGSEVYRRMLQGFDALRHAGLNVLIIAHAQITNFKDPAGEAYDHYTLSCDKRINAMLKEWADAVLFADFDKSTKKVGEGFNERVIAKSYGERVMFTEHRASHDAKNRYNLPEKMPLDYAQFAAHIDAFFAPQNQNAPAMEA